MTQGEASLVVPTLGEGTSSRRHLSAAEAPVTESRGARPTWQERMGLTLAEALRLPALAGTEVLAGSGGLDRVVRHVVVDDPADPLAVAGPDVLVVLGARLPPADPANYRALVERLDSMGTAALAHRRTEGPPQVPAEVLAEADRRGLPVLSLPADLRMGEVVSEVLGAVVDRQSEALALSNRMHDQFIDVALSGGGLSEVTEQLAVSLDGVAVLGLGPDREIVTSAGPSADVAEISDWLWLLDAEAEDEMAMMAPSRRLSGLRADQTVVTPADVLADADLSPADGILLVPGHHELPGGVGEYAVAPVMAGDQRHGWLVAVHRSGPMLVGAGAVLERAAVVSALSVIRQQAVHSVELRFQGDLVRRLVAGALRHTERALAQTRSFGWRLDGPVAVLVTATETAADPQADPTRALDVLDRLADGWRAALETEVSGAAVAGLSTEIVTLLPLDGRTPEEVTSLVGAVTGRVNARVRRVGRVLGTGIGRPAGSLAALGEAHQQASRALGVGQEIHGTQAVTHFDQLGVFRLLSLIPDSTELRTYVDEVLGTLADASDADSADLRETLRVLLETNLNVAESARRLHFHYNTMRYRIGKLERLLGPFTTDPTLRLNLLLALHAARMRGLDQPHRPPVDVGLTLPPDDGLDALV
ncbi:PucR family transcriptional regulator ligand-binding domain-containing protein [Geodermatophilus sp. DSM 44513]|uniref:helix-turn-helix domain-containing protein n=1 Tax=Geodermatophilus sp. DSM 44513 TaxID=1528104 RepID=UPI0028F73B05|nr:PucR family transcriptional regulator ligand-binding domain-containing protein [Geodermatophilus sp. DSM 44513]WNV77507.1 PucR family transcriptional regulator ligand-binding domain-containing protein [Geodermatophilus sp. DSM 44513]